MSQKQRIFRVDCPKQRIASSNEFKIFLASNNSLLRVVVSASGISKSDLDRAAKCAKLSEYTVYDGNGKFIKPTDIPIKKNVYLRKHVKKSIGNKTRIFSVCPDGIATKPPVKKVKKMTDINIEKKHRLIQNAINALVELKKVI